MTGERPLHRRLAIVLLDIASGMDRDQALKLLRGGEDGLAELNRRRKEGEEIPAADAGL